MYIIELTVPWENSAAEAYERKRLRYTDLDAEAQQRGWKVKVYPVKSIQLKKDVDGLLLHPPPSC